MEDTHRFDEEEFSVINDRNFLLVKNNSIDKICKQFNALRNALSSEVVRKSGLAFPSGTDVTTGKTAKGESYKGLPYVVLDYPRLFSKKTIFAFRTMFWWGSFYSFTLHLQGDALNTFRKNISSRTGELIKDGQSYICVGNDPWDYRYHKENYLPTADMQEKELQHLLNTKDFLKISRKMDVSEYEMLQEKGVQALKDFLYYLS